MVEVMWKWDGGEGVVFNMDGGTGRKGCGRCKSEEGSEIMDGMR